MNPKLFWLLTAIFLALLHRAEAQQANKIPCIGFLSASSKMMEHFSMVYASSGMSTKNYPHRASLSQRQIRPPTRVGARVGQRQSRLDRHPGNPCRSSCQESDSHNTRRNGDDWGCYQNGTRGQFGCARRKHHRSIVSRARHGHGTIGTFQRGVAQDHQYSHADQPRYLHRDDRL